MRACLLRRIAVAACAGVAALPAAASAGTAQFVGGDEFLFTAAAGESNVLTLTQEGAVLRLRDTGAPVTPGAGCSPVGANEVTCDTAAPGLEIALIDINLGDMNDRGTIGASVTSFPSGSLNGGTGSDELTNLGGSDRLEFSLSGDGPGSGAATDNDKLFGGPFRERLLGGEGDDQASGGGGNDSMDSGPGNDLFDGGAGDDSYTADPQDGADTLIGGPGIDEASWRNVDLPVSLTQNGVADDGLPGEGDNLGSDIEFIEGGTGDDFITGSSINNQIQGNDGDDEIEGGAGDDDLDGDDGDDSVSGGAGDEILIAGDDGNDEMSGGPGDDYLEDDNETEAGADADTLSGGSGHDTASYETSFIAVAVSLDNAANDGAADEGDDVRSDIEDLIGGSASDRLIGSNAPNQLSGGAGRDALLGRGGADGLLGGRGRDNLSGQRGRDLLSGEAGADRITSRGGQPDRVLCGGGIDIVRADRSDGVRADCDRVQLPRSAKAARR